MDIDAVKEYLRIDDDADDMTIELMMNAAKEYIKDAVGKCDEKNPKNADVIHAYHTGSLRKSCADSKGSRQTTTDTCGRINGSSATGVTTGGRKWLISEN